VCIIKYATDNTVLRIVVLIKHKNVSLTTSWNFYSIGFAIFTAAVNSLSTKLNPTPYHCICTSAFPSEPHYLLREYVIIYTHDIRGFRTSKPYFGSYRFVIDRASFPRVTAVRVARFGPSSKSTYDVVSTRVELAFADISMSESGKRQQSESRVSAWTITMNTCLRRARAI